MARNYSEEYARRKERARQEGFEGGYSEKRNARARRAGFENASEEQRVRKETAEILGHKLRSPTRFRKDPRGYADLLRAWREGKLMGQAKKSGNKAGAEQHRRNMDFALLDLQVQRPDFAVEEDFWNS